MTAVLISHHQSWTVWFRNDVEQRFIAQRSIAVLADTLGEWFSKDDFGSCPFINIAAETGLNERREHVDLASFHMRTIELHVKELAARLGLSEPDKLAREILLCLTGMIVQAQIAPERDIVATGRSLLAALEQRYKPEALGPQRFRIHHPLL
jgi:hypothetical protein